MKTLIAIIVTVITLVAAAPMNETIKLGNKPKLEIINGDIVEDRAIPYQVFIQSDVFNNYYDDVRYCSGTLISQRYLLTAARCVNGSTRLYVVMGTNSLGIPVFTKGTNRLDMPAFTTTMLYLYGADIVIHEDYHFNGEVAINDIALVKLPGVLYLSDAIQIVKLPSRADITKDYVGETARISGWGKTSLSQAEGEYSDSLMEADVQIVDHQTCKDAFQHLTDFILCSNGINGTGACDSDFGGPLVVDGVQIGIISVINDNCEQPIAFTKITDYLDWIENNSDVVIH